jgi:hypothetical protein
MLQKRQIDDDKDRSRWSFSSIETRVSHYYVYPISRPFSPILLDHYSPRLLAEQQSTIVEIPKVWSLNDRSDSVAVSLAAIGSVGWSAIWTGGDSVGRPGIGLVANWFGDGELVFWCLNDGGGLQPDIIEYRNIHSFRSHRLLTSSL